MKRVIHLTAAAVLAAVFALGVSGCSGAKSAQEEPVQPKDTAAQAQPSADAASMAERIHAAATGPAPAADPGDEAVGEIFGVPVPAHNYYFAKRVAYMYPGPWGANDLPEAEREAFVWDSLILHFESYRRGIEALDSEVEQMANSILDTQKQTFTRSGDPEKYKAWIREQTQQEPELFENQLKFMIQIHKLKEQVREAQQVAATEEEMQQEFLNEQNHVGGEAVMFDSKDQAQAFYEQVKSAKDWEKMKKKGDRTVRPISLMTLEAYMDLWGIPKDQMYAFHGSEIGTVGPPMPFGTNQWAVYRLLEKRTGDLKDFPEKHEYYEKQMQAKKKWEGLQAWLKQVKASAQLKTYPEKLQ